MTTQDNVAKARAFWEDGFGKNNQELLDQLLASSFIGHDPSLPGGKVEQPAGVKQLRAMLHAGMPDLRYTVEDAFGDGDRALVRWTARGTHKGDLFGVPASGKQATFQGVGIHRFAGGKCEEAWVLWDTMGLMQQLDAIPQPAQATR